MKKKITDFQKKIMPDYTGQAFSFGNAKLPRTTMIVNLTSATNCPSCIRGLCEISNICYAKKCERVYPNYRKKNLIVEDFFNHASDEEIIQLMEAYIDAAPERITHIRLNEAGDFQCQEQVYQMNRIARYFLETRNIRTYIYTHRSDLDFSGADCIVVNASCQGVKGTHRMFVCTPRKEFEKMMPSRKRYLCPGDCKLCHVCTNARFKGTIYCRQH